ncbi:hypothetical protein DV532_07490 [Pseudomonas sp. Leaf58]|nr:hypothetical protein DV532_07490 [Pseudomonas sp. Leaf58]
MLATARVFYFRPLLSSTRCCLLLVAFASKRAIVQATQIATSGGRAKGLRREVTGMDARQALRPHGWGLQRVLPGASP